MMEGMDVKIDRFADRLDPRSLARSLADEVRHGIHYPVDAAEFYRLADEYRDIVGEAIISSVVDTIAFEDHMIIIEREAFEQGEETGKDCGYEEGYETATNEVDKIHDEIVFILDEVGEMAATIPLPLAFTERLSALADAVGALENWVAGTSGNARKRAA